jgi:hypothetical protein
MYTGPIKLIDPARRAYARALIGDAPDGWVVTIKEPTRSLDQNARMWAMLTDISQQCTIDGKHYTPDEWKIMVMHACGWENQFLPGIGDGRPFPAGFSSSRLTIRQMTTLIDWMHAYGAEHGVVWSEKHPDERAA